MHNIYDSAKSKQKLTQLLNKDKAGIWQRKTSNKFEIISDGKKYGVKAIDTMDSINK